MGFSAAGELKRKPCLWDYTAMAEWRSPSPVCTENDWDMETWKGDPLELWYLVIGDDIMQPVMASPQELGPQEKPGRVTKTYRIFLIEQVLTGF